MSFEMLDFNSDNVVLPQSDQHMSPDVAIELRKHMYILKCIADAHLAHNIKGFSSHAMPSA